MKLFAATVISLSLLASASAQTNQAGVASVQDEQTVKITRSGSQPSRKGPAENFTGSVSIAPLFQGNDPARTSGAHVTFKPGARTAWHTHPLGQILIVTAGLGWRTAIRNRNVRAIVSYEPAFDFPFPEGEAPPGMTLGGRELKPLVVPMSDFMVFTKIPVVIYYGDNIPEKPSANPGQEQWRIFFEMAKRWRDAVNRRGGNVTLVHLPEIGIRGNTRFPMSDMNNREIADLLSKFLKEKGLD